MKQVIFGISCASLVLSAIWAFRTDWDWEPLICLGGSIVGVLSTADFGFSSEQLVGTWLTVIESPVMHMEQVTLYGQNGKYAAIGKILRFPNVFYQARLYLSITGDYHVKNNSIYSHIENIEIIYSYGFPFEITQLLIANMQNHGPSEILNLNENSVTVKTDKGLTLTSKKISSKIDTDYFEKFAEDKL